MAIIKNHYERTFLFLANDLRQLQDLCQIFVFATLKFAFNVEFIQDPYYLLNSRNG